MILILTTFLLLMHENFSQLRRVDRLRDRLKLCNCFYIFLELSSHDLQLTRDALVQHLLFLLIDDSLHLLTIVVLQTTQVIIKQVLN